MAPPDRIAYILGTFPQPSQTFIAREIRGLLASGTNLEIFALRRKTSDGLESLDRAWFDRVHATPRSFAPSTIAANLWWCRRDPARYWQSLKSIVMLPHQPRILRVRALALFAVSAWIARTIDGRGGCRQVHGHFALAQTEVAMAVAALLGRPFSFTAHARDIYRSPSALPEKMRAASLVVTCTAHNRDYLQRLCPGLPSDRIHLVYHGIDDGTLHGAASRAAAVEPPMILAAGRLVDKKGFDVLIAACARLVERGVLFRCRIIGDGPRQHALARAAQDAKLDGTIDLPGWLPPDRLQALMQRSTAFVVPSQITSKGDRDGIPNVVLEAMAAARPVIATNVSGIPEAVRSGITGILVSPGDADALADAIERLVKNRSEADRMGLAGLAHVKEAFGLAASSARLSALFAGTDARSSSPSWGGSFRPA